MVIGTFLLLSGFALLYHYPQLRQKQWQLVRHCNLITAQNHSLRVALCGSVFIMLLLLKAWNFLLILSLFMGIYYLKIFADKQAKALSLRKVIFQLPHFLDLMSMMAEAGIETVQGIKRICDQSQSSILRDELLLMLHHIDLGKNRTEAFIHFAERNPHPLLLACVHQLTQALEMGSPLVPLFHNHAQNVREKCFYMVEKRAMKAPVLLLLPLVCCFMPVIFIVIFGPIGMLLLNS